MRILFLHQNFPGQFLAVAKALQASGQHEILAITDAANKRPEIVRTIRYPFNSKAFDGVPYVARSFTVNAMRGQAAALAMEKIKQQGFTPDLVIGHLGWGETQFVRDVWPDTKLLVHAEYFYNANNSNIDFDPEFASPNTLTTAFSVRARNATILLAMNEADAAVAPTEWQTTRYPPALRQKIETLHEGINTDIAKPDGHARFTVKDKNLTLTPQDEVITFVNRNLEPYRGYHVFMRALPTILAARPLAHAVLVGGEGVSYSRPPPEGKSWKTIFLDEVKEKLPMERVHFVGQVPYQHFISLMQITSAHIYLTVPFVLSWSMLEAMAAGALVIGSRTPPVEEVIVDGKNGLLFDFFDTAMLAEKTIQALEHPARCSEMRANARQTILERYDLKTICLPRWLALIEHVAARK